LHFENQGGHLESVGKPTSASSVAEELKQIHEDLPGHPEVAAQNLRLGCSGQRHVQQAWCVQAPGPSDGLLSQFPAPFWIINQHGERSERGECMRRQPPITGTNTGESGRLLEMIVRPAVVGFGDRHPTRVVMTPADACRRPNTLAPRQGGLEQRSGPGGVPPGQLKLSKPEVDRGDELQVIYPAGQVGGFSHELLLAIGIRPS
jgi:hypothetical protein